MKTARLVVFSLMVLVSVAAFGQSPVIVAQVSLRNQGQAIGPTPLLTPPTTGVYRVSAYISSSNAPSTGYWSLHIKWVDENALRKSPRHWIEVGTSVLKYSQGTLIVRAVAGQPIKYDVDQSGPPDFDYNLFITVEQLESD